MSFWKANHHSNHLKPALDIMYNVHKGSWNQAITLHLNTRHIISLYFITIYTLEAFEVLNVTSVLLPTCFCFCLISLLPLPEPSFLITCGSIKIYILNMVEIHKVKYSSCIFWSLVHENHDHIYINIIWDIIMNLLCLAWMTCDVN